MKVGHTHTLPTSTTNHTPSRALLPLILIGVQDTTGTPYTHDMEMEHTNALHYTTVQRHYRYASSTEQTTDIPIRPPPRRRSYRPKSPQPFPQNKFTPFPSYWLQAAAAATHPCGRFFFLGAVHGPAGLLQGVVEHAGCHRGGEVDERVAQVETPPAHHQLVGYIQSQYHMDFFFRSITRSKKQANNRYKYTTHTSVHQVVTTCTDR